LLIAGYGDKAFEERCKQLNNKCENIHYYGKVKYEEGQNIMYNADIIYAMYCKINPNHIFAAPNKYYEAMMLAKPIISTKGTIVGEKIEKHDIGYTIEENKEELLALLNSLNKGDIVRKGAMAHKLWNEEYKDYVEQFMNKEYANLIKEKQV
jgi:glycosyltransferase involved in cell wall biosynthesis